MAPRVTSDLLLVGSLPAASTEEALRAARRSSAPTWSSRCRTARRGRASAWVGYERERLVRPNPDIVVVRGDDVADRASRGTPTRRRSSPSARASAELHWDTWPRIDDAIASYQVFSALRAEGVIPAGLRFQVGLPFPSSALNGFKADFAADYPIARAGLRGPGRPRDSTRLTAAIPPADLAIQWDFAYETQDIEGVLAWTSEGAWERFAGPVTRLTRLIPEETLVGYHLCYGTFPEWPMYEARDMACSSGWRTSRSPTPAAPSTGCTWPARGTCAARTAASSARSSISSPATPGCSSASCCRSTASPGCGVATRPRRATWPTSASRMYCGFGRQPGRTPREAMREHRDVVTAVRRP